MRDLDTTILGRTISRPSYQHGKKGSQRMFSHDVNALNRQVLALSLQDMLPGAARESRERHPLFRHVPAMEVRGSRVVLPADVRAQAPLPAVFDVPFSAASFVARLPNQGSDRDQQVEWLLGVLSRAIRTYETANRRAMYSATGQRLGFRQLLPSKIEPQVVAGIDEASTPGWRSFRQVETSRNGQRSLLDSVSMLAQSCRATRSSMVVVGRNRWHQLMAEFSPQQIFYVSTDSSDPSLCFGRTQILHDGDCGDDDVFLVEPHDFAHILGDFRVAVDQRADGQAVEVTIFGREQLATQRRYRSGSLMPQAIQRRHIGRPAPR